MEACFHHDSLRGEPDALTAHDRFWEVATLTRPSPSLMLRIGRESSIYWPRVAGRAFPDGESLGRNRVILAVRRQDPIQRTFD